MSGATQVLSDDLLHFGENRHNTLPSGLDKQLAVRIAPNVLPKEVETFFYVRDQGLFRRKDQTTFSQKDSTSGFTVILSNSSECPVMMKSSA
jgi:hypothetical protein